jgi:hypothetical protein
VFQFRSTLCRRNQTLCPSFTFSAFPNFSHFCFPQLLAFLLPQLLTFLLPSLQAQILTISPFLLQKPVNYSPKHF